MSERKAWVKPQVKQIRAGSAESGTHPGSKDGPPATRQS